MNQKDDLEEDVLSKFSSDPKEIKTKGNANETPIDEVQQKWIMNSKIIDLFVNNIKNDKNLRNIYAGILLGMLGFMIAALIVIFVLVGCEVLKYSNTTFNIFITGVMAEIFILVRVIVKYLFKDNLTNALLTILKNNNHSSNDSKSTLGNKKKNNKLNETQLH